MSEVKVIVSRERCVGVAECVARAPGAFELDDEGFSVFRPSGEWTEAQLIEAAQGCPSLAIEVFKDGIKIS